MKSVLVVISIHHNNTLKIANAIAKVLDTQIKKPLEINPKELQNYSLVGFGSGIYGEKHHKSLLDFTDKLPQVINKKAFIFSTSGITSKNKASNDHLPLRKELESKGYLV